ncbi:MAG: PEGA domain-containing protein [Myxococcales bacterium]|nr:PEGA domain-containing protein [Myxococcales bacterium]
MPNLSAHRHTRAQSSWLGCLALLLVVGFPATSALAKDCASLYRRGQIEESGECFAKEADAMGASKGLPRLQRIKKGRLFLNAARLFSLAAKRSKNENKIRLYERSLQLLERYTKENLYEDDERKNSALTELRRLRNKIGYGRINIFSYDPRANICLTYSSGRKRCKKGSVWRAYLPPGQYTMSVKYPDLAEQTRPLTVTPNENSTQGFTPPKVEIPVELYTNHPHAKITLQGAALEKKITHEGKEWKLKLAPGSYKVTLAYPGVPPYERTIHVSVGSGVTKRYRPPSATLELSTVPAGAQIFVNGVYRGVTPAQILVPDGETSIVFKSLCHRPATKKLDVQPQTRNNVSVMMEIESRYQDWQKKKAEQPTLQISGWVALVSGVLVAGFGGAAQFISNGAHAEAEKQRELYLTNRTNVQQYVTAYEAEAQRGNTWRTVGFVGFGVGGAAMIFGITQLARSGLPSLRSLECEITESDLKRKQL